ncbi:MAG: phage antirepressor KilAC domain-containing protein [Prevotella sp.]|nr:phage antirepressor KilAC domain-containing protein [Prevotella sp.]
MEKTELEKMSGVQNVIGTTTINGFLFEIYGTVENPLFLAKDIATVLEHSHVPTMMQSVDDEEKLMCTILTSGQRREMNCVTEDGFYELMMLSRKPIAKDFKKGVKKVLHELRTKGEVRTNYNIPKTYADALQLAANQAKQIEEQNKLIEEQKPKVEFFDQVTDSKDAVDMKECAKILNMGIGRNRLFEFLRSRSILDRKNLPYQIFIDRGYFRTVETSYTKSDGTNCINIKTVVYQKGMEYIRNLIKNAGK